jgi:hypothetical protein
VDDDACRDLDIPFGNARMSPSVRNVAPVLLGGGIVVFLPVGLAEAGLATSTWLSSFGMGWPTYGDIARHIVASLTKEQVYHSGCLSQPGERYATTRIHRPTGRHRHIPIVSIILTLRPSISHDTTTLCMSMVSIDSLSFPRLPQ